MAQQIDFNADMGESFGLWERGADAEMLECISSANVACGFHAGDPSVMRRTVLAARDKGVAIGAHPGYPDLRGFGRREMRLAPADVRNDVLYQVGALQAFLKAAGVRMQHVKPHGALYTMALDDEQIARAILEAVCEVDPSLAVLTLHGSAVWHEAARLGVRAVPEFFADRPMRADGSVVMFNWRLEDCGGTPEGIAKRALRALTEGVVAGIDGGAATGIAFETICVHSDTPGAGAIARALKRELEAAGWEIRAFSA
jgi:UPF0271 protein